MWKISLTGGDVLKTIYDDETLNTVPTYRSILVQLLNIRSAEVLANTAGPTKC